MNSFRTPRIQPLPLVSGFLALLLAQSFAQIPAFPGAEGYGAHATGGRGGDVYHVTNLNASGAGSFAEGISTVPAAGRTIVFDVSGYIRLPSGSGGTRMTASKVTIAGQTAPGDGIGFFNNNFRISGDDVIVRHLRFRRGKTESSGDCINLDSGSINSILDHLSVMFSTDENISSYNSAPDNLTMQYSLNSWGLQSHSAGGLWDQKRATSHHNLWSHNHTRNPKARPNGLLEWINNVTYDWNIGFIMGDSTSNQNWKSNIVGNYFICPPGNTRSKALVKGLIGTNGKPNFTIHVSNNLIDNNGNSVLDGVDNGYGIAEGTQFSPGQTGSSGSKAYYWSATPIDGAPDPGVAVTVDSPLLAYKKVVSNAGALRLDSSYSGALRDEVDTILINNLTSLTRAIVSSPGGTGASNNGFGTLESELPLADTDRDGTPDLYENAVGMNPAVADHNTAFSSGAITSGSTFFPTTSPTGYTYLEEYLHFKASPHTFTAKNTAADPSFADVDLSRYTGGFVKAPVTFVLSNVVNGTAVLRPDGVTARFTPTQNFNGRARFDFTVTDGDGSSWTQRFMVLVTTAGIPKNLKWMGDGTANNWNTTSSNWLRNGAAVAFNSQDTVTFDESGSNSPGINLTGAVQPGAITVNADKDYTFGGSGSIAGNTGLLKSGTGTLTLSNANSYAGGTTINNGTVAMGASGALGTGPVTLNDSTIVYSGATTLPIENTLTVSGDATFIALASGSHNLNPPITAAGADASITVDSGAGTVFTLQSDMTGFPGSLNFSTGDLRFFANATDLSSIVLNAGNATVYSHFNTATSISIGSLSGEAGAVLQGAASRNNGTDTFVIGGLGLDSTFAGTMKDSSRRPLAITKAGAGQLTLSGDSTHTGSTTVSAGTLQVDGSLGNTALSVADGATLSGGGTIGSSSGGAVTASGGATISPGNAPNSAGTLGVGNGLTLGAVTLPFDLSNNPSGANNDRIVLNGGALNLTGTPSFDFNFLDGTLGNGTYTLVSGGSSSSGNAPTSNLPTGARQTFNLGAPSGGAIQLVVSGTPPASLVWTGTGGGSGVWDPQSTSSWSGGPTPTFFNFDAVTFNDTSTNGNVTLSGVLAPRTLAVDNGTTNYSFSGTGSIDGTTSLTKFGTGTLTISPTYSTLSSTTTSGSNTVTLASTSGLSAGMVVGGSGIIPGGTTITAVVNATTVTISQNATATGTNSLYYYARNTFSGGTFLDGGTIVLANDVANAYGLGTGPITFNGGTLTMFQSSGFAPTGVSNSFPLDLVVPAGQTGTLHGDPRCDFRGNLTGGGTFNFRARSNRMNLFGDWSAFTGNINVTTDSGGAFLSMATSYHYPGFPLAAVNLADGVNLFYSGTMNSGEGTMIEIGELSGDPSSVFRGGATSGRNLTYRIGGRTDADGEAVFGGTIEERSENTTTSFIKIGPGTWTLDGTCSWNGGTSVEEGTLRIGGTMSCQSALIVEPGATLDLANGSVTTDTVSISGGASLTGSGTINADLTNDGAASLASGGQITINGEVVNNGTMRLTGGTGLNATGSFVNNGVLDLLTGSGNLPADLVNNGVVIDSSAARVAEVGLEGSTFTATIASFSGHDYQLQKATSLGVGTVWQDVGPPQSGVTQPDGSPTLLQFSDSEASAPSSFYRFAIAP